MPPLERIPPTAGGEPEPDTSPGSEDALSLAEEAEAEAEEAEAVAAAARARARALRLRREAGAKTANPVAAPEIAQPITAEPITADAITEPDGDTEDAPDAREPEAAVARRRVPRIGVRAAVGALAIVLTLGFIVAGGYMMRHHREVVAEQQHAAEFEAAARQGVVTLMSLDFSNAKDDVQRILDNTTGEFRDEFAGQADAFTQVATQSKVVTEATVNAVAVRAMTQDTANVLVAVTTRVSNAAAEQQPPRSWRLSVDVARDDGQIKLSKVEFVP